MPAPAPSARPPGPAGPTPTAPIDRFVGRSRELAALSAALREAPTPSGPVRLLTGPAGVGKTRLAEEVALAVRHDGATVAWAHCPDDLTAPPYWPWTQVVRALLGRTRGTDLAALVLDDPTGVDRFDLFDAVADVIRAGTEAAPLLVVLDDLHAADDATLQLTRFLARHLRADRLLLVATVRTTPATSPDVDEHLHALARLGHRIEIAGLAVDDVGHLLDDAGLAEDLHAATGGNPLHVHQLLRELQAGGPSPTPPAVDAEGRDRALRRAVRVRIDTLDDDPRRVLGVAAVLGPQPSITDLHAVVDADDQAAVAPALVDLEHRGFLRADAHQVTFRHPLVHDVALSTVDPVAAHRLHRRAAAVIGAEPDRIGETAHHLLRAGPEHRTLAVDALRAAAAVASRALAHEDAAVHLRRALDALGDDPTDRATRLDLLLELGAARWRAGHGAAADRDFEAAWDTASDLGDADSLARAVFRNGLEYYFSGETRPGAVDRAERALAAQPPGPSPTRARLLAELTTHHLVGPDGRGRALAEEAVAMARRFDDPLVLGNALLARLLTDLGPHTLRRRIADSHEILACARETDDYRLTVHGRFLLMGALLEDGDIRALDHELSRQHGLVDELGEPRFSRMALWFRGMRAMLDGDVAAAEPLVERVFEISQGMGDPDGVGVYGGQIGVLRWMHGRVTEMEPVYLAMRTAEPHEPLWPAVLAWMWANAGQADAARGALAAVPDPADLPGSMHWLLTVTTYAEAAVRVGTDDQVEKAWSALLPFADHMVPIAMGAAMWGTVAKPLGHLALRRGHVDEGIEHLRTAVRTCARLGARPWLIEAQLDLADALDRQHPGDPDAAAVRAEAVAAARALGLDVFLAPSAGRPDRSPIPTPALAPADEATGTRPATTAATADEGQPRVRVIGAFDVTGSDGTVARWTSRKARELLKILVSRRGAPISREELMDLLWPGEDPAVLANRLSVALSTVRRSLDPGRSIPADRLVTTSVDAVALRLDVVAVDVEDLLTETRAVLDAHRRGDPGAATRAAGVLDRHRGEALPDEPHADWAEPVRHEVRIAHLALARLVAADARARGDDLHAAEAHRRILDLDPFDEPAHLGLVHAFAAMGAHGQADAAYRTYGDRMGELGVPAAARPTA